MSDTLRDRIAAEDEKHCQVLIVDSGGWACRCGTRFPSDLSDLEAYREWRLHKADAVVTEIGLREEKAVRNVAFTPPVVYTYGTPEAAVKDYVGAPLYVRQDLQLVRRYVTEWTADE